MKVSIYDECKTDVIAVLSLDGDPAVEEKDFIPWRGEYHKNGKWSYTEGGVALKDGIILYNRRNTHACANNQRRAMIIMDNQIVTDIYVMGPAANTPERPKLEKRCAGSEIPISIDVWEKIIDVILDWLKPEIKAQTLERWGAMEKFI